MDAGLIQQNNFWSSLMAMFRVAVLLTSLHFTPAIASQRCMAILPLNLPEDVVVVIALHAFRFCSEKVGKTLLP